MKQFTLELNKAIQRPVAKLADWHQFNVMLDTGALFPVWVDDEEILMDLGAECVRESVEFGGFGGKAKGNLYRLPYFRIGELIYPGLPVIAYQIEIGRENITHVSIQTKRLANVPRLLDKYEKRSWWTSAVMRGICRNSGAAFPVRRWSRGSGACLLMADTLPTEKRIMMRVRLSGGQREESCGGRAPADRVSPADRGGASGTARACAGTARGPSLHDRKPMK